MVKNCDGSRNILISLLAFLVVAFAVSCKTGPAAGGNEIALKIDKHTPSQWGDIFGEDTVLSFTKDGEEFELFHIGSVTLDDSGDYFISDGKRGGIFQFNSAGEYMRSIGARGEGPGEYSFVAASCFDREKNFYIFDIGKRRINKYSPPTYQYESQVPSSLSIWDMIVDNNGNFILFVHQGEKLLRKLDRVGHVTGETFVPRDDLLTKFFSRFGLGRLSNIPDEGFLFIWPGEYKIYFFDYDLSLKKILYAGTPSHYFPAFEKLPRSLSPYNYTPAHARWWEKALHPGLMYYLGERERLFVVVLAEFKNLSQKYYLNVHDLDGKTYAAGVEVPFDGIVRYAKDGYIYVVEESSFNDKGEPLPLKLHRFKFKH
ncbi:MAG: hypothetical protein QG657_3020 [Acidobacteriota bacterium]|nr:hypothetical protein [Acidobacteriota bacterium]